jgi:hypothetical protein
MVRGPFGGVGRGVGDTVGGGAFGVAVVQGR